MTDTITLTGMTFYTHVGCTPEERKVGQHLELDVTLHLDLREAGASDDIDQSVDYAKVHEALKRAIEGRERKLLEAIAEDAVTALRAFPLLESATVRVRKPAPPFPGFARHAEIVIHRPLHPGRSHGAR